MDNETLAEGRAVRKRRPGIRLGTRQGQRLRGAVRQQAQETVRAAARRGRWTYGVHEGLNPGWRLDDSPLVLDFDPLYSGGPLRGCWMLWIDGTEENPIDHYLDAAMAFVENEHDQETCDA